MPLGFSSRSARFFTPRSANILCNLFIPAAICFAAGAGEVVESTPLVGRDDAAGAQRFFPRDARESGIDFIPSWTPPPQFSGLIDSAFAGGGVTIGDVDGDGSPDVYLTRPFGGGRLFRNLGSWRFEDITTTAGLAGDGKNWATGGTLIDLDSDGDLDLMVCGYGCPNRIFINDGKARFTDAAPACGLDFTGGSISMTFADYDKDGRLDAYLVTNRYPHDDAPTRARFAEIERQLRKDPQTGRYSLPDELLEQYDIVTRADGKPMLVKAGQADLLYHNEGTGPDGLPRFRDVTRQAGLWDNGRGNAAVWFDYDNDKWPDLYVANDFHGADRLWRNQGDGTFRDTAPELLPHLPWFSMGCDAGDLNNDGWLDLVTSDMAGSTHFKDKMSMGEMDQNGWFLEVGAPRQYMRNAIFLNSRAGPFFEAAHMLRIAATDWTWSMKLADLDCDGWLDLYVTNGMTGDFLNSDLRASMSPSAGSIRNAPLKKDIHMAFQNAGGLEFRNVSAPWGLAREAVSFGAAFGDLDGDGDPDIVVNNFGEAPSLYENMTTGAGSLLVKLVGKGGNRAAIGARVTAHIGEQTLTREMAAGRGYLSSDDPRLHFGLGASKSIDQLTVRWPSGTDQMLGPLPAGRLYTIREAEPALTTRAAAAPKKRTLFNGSAAFAGIAHRERAFDDFKRQPLLPNKLSQLGPCLAWSDVDNDGREDFFLGGAAGTEGRIYSNVPGPDGAVRFAARALPPFNVDLDCEDLGAVFFDADGDGDPDLHVVSGGVECEPNSAVLADRLYLNDGKGSFTKAPAVRFPVIRESGCCACVADFDQDGDLDLFAGGRVVPGKYPLSPGSRILRNDGGHFVDVTSSVAPGLAGLQRVTSALWSDADDDGRLDLLVTTDWGAVHVFRNLLGERPDPSGAMLADVTEAAGLGSMRGWWNGIAAGDFNQDGRLDYVVTNFGLNTKYHPTPEHPVRLYYGDFDGSGNPQIVEAKTMEDGVLLPVRGKSCSQAAMPFLRNKFPLFRDFASNTLDQIYDPEKLADAVQLGVETLESGVLWNETQHGGPPRFVFAPFPRLAQIAPAFGAVVLDADSDGRDDIVLAQNFYTPQRETGHMDGGLSILLRNSGGRKFEAVWPDASGVVVPADAKSLTVCDFNNDRRPDLVFGINDAPILAFTGAGSDGDRPFVVNLRGRSGNRTAIGAKMTLQTSLGSCIREVHAGSGYLSQSSPAQFFALRADEQVQLLEVRWPCGMITKTRDQPKDGVLEVSEPAAVNVLPAQR